MMIDPAENTPKGDRRCDKSGETKTESQTARIRITAVLGILVVVLLTASWAADEADDAPFLWSGCPRK